MTETHVPYLTHPQAHAATAERSDPRQSKAEAEIARLKKRVAQLEEAARKVCTEVDPNDHDPETYRSVIRWQNAIRALGNLIDYPGWWQL